MKNLPLLVFLLLADGIFAQSPRSVRFRVMDYSSSPAKMVTDVTIAPYNGSGNETSRSTDLGIYVLQIGGVKSGEMLELVVKKEGYFVLNAKIPDIFTCPMPEKATIRPIDIPIIKDFESIKLEMSKENKKKIDQLTIDLDSFIRLDSIGRLAQKINENEQVHLRKVITDLTQKIDIARPQGKQIQQARQERDSFARLDSIGQLAQKINEKEQARLTRIIAEQSQKIDELNKIKDEALEYLAREKFEQDSVDAQISLENRRDAPKITFSGYAEPYYSYSFNKPVDGNLPGFLYSYNRHNEITVNLAYLKAAVNTRRFHGNLAMMAGTYANANLSAEPGTLKNLYEANAGVKLANHSELWIDAGIFISHLGIESPVGKDCWTLTRSISFDNSPAYESGAKLSYTTPDYKWLFSALVLNGWQTIQKQRGDAALAGGTQIQYRPSERVQLNSSSFFGADRPDSLSLRRVFHDFFGLFQFNVHFGLILGLDTGWEQNVRKGAAANVWYSPLLIAQYTLNERLTLAGRVEYYSDKNGVLIATGTPNGFQTLGVSANLDVQIHNNAVWRIEGKLYSSKDEIFVKDQRSSTANAVVTTAFSVWF